MTTREDFVQCVHALEGEPFPQRYALLHRLAPQPLRAPNQRMANAENLRMIAAASTDLSHIGFRRVANILRWEPFHVRRILEYGIRTGHVEQVSRSLFRINALPPLETEVTA